MAVTRRLGDEKSLPVYLARSLHLQYQRLLHRQSSHPPQNPGDSTSSRQDWNKEEALFCYWGRIKVEALDNLSFVRREFPPRPDRHLRNRGGPPDGPEATGFRLARASWPPFSRTGASSLVLFCCIIIEHVLQNNTAKSTSYGWDPLSRFSPRIDMLTSSRATRP